MIALSLTEIASVTGGMLHGAATGARSSSPAPSSPTPARPSPAASTWPGSASPWTATSSSVRPATTGPWLPSTSRPVDELPCVVVDDVQAAFVAISRAVLDRASGPHRHRHHRLVGQDEHQGPAGRCPRCSRAHDRARRLLQLRGRGAAHRHPGHGRDPLPRGRDGRPRHRAHRLPHDDRATADRGRPQRRHRPRRRVRLPRGHRTRQVRAGAGAAAPTGWPCSTPTTRGRARHVRGLAGPRGSRRRGRGRGRPGRGRHGGQGRSCDLPGGDSGRGGHDRAPARRPSPRRQRTGRPRGRARVRHTPVHRLPRRSPRPASSAGGAWTSPSAPTA